MSAERKKVEKKPVIQIEPKKRVEPMPVPIVVEKVEVKAKVETKTETKTEPRAKRSENKYIRLGMDAKMDERKAISERVQKGELKLAYYATDSDVGYHYYLVIK
jgi:hypothetical protein